LRRTSAKLTGFAVESFSSRPKIFAKVGIVDVDADVDGADDDDDDDDNDDDVDVAVVDEDENEDADVDEGIVFNIDVETFECGKLYDIIADVDVDIDDDVGIDVDVGVESIMIVVNQLNYH
jgi:hypothetical protein